MGGVLGPGDQGNPLVDGDENQECHKHLPVDAAQNFGVAIMPLPELLTHIEGAEKVFKEDHGFELDLEPNPIQWVTYFLWRQRPQMDPTIIEAGPCSFSV